MLSINWNGGGAQRHAGFRTVQVTDIGMTLVLLDYMDDWRNHSHDGILWFENHKPVVLNCNGIPCNSNCIHLYGYFIGSAGTIGVALMGIASGLGAPLPIVAGAVESGAYFGDKMSPLSDTTNLAPIAAGSKLYDHIGHMLCTTGPGFIICCIVYTVVGMNLNGLSETDPAKVSAKNRPFR